MRWSQHPRADRAAFTLIELLVVIGILTVLVGILLPVLSKARRSAMGTVCAHHLRQLAAACVMYQNDNGAYPAPVYDPALGDVYPTQVQARLLNDLGPYLGYKEVRPADHLGDLPVVVKCPFREQVPVYTDPITAGATFWYTGYDYVARVDEPLNRDGVVLRPARLARAKGPTRGVLFADTVFWSSLLGPRTWVYWHLRDAGVRYNGLGAADTSGLVGQNRAWSDGSVEWLDGSEINPDPSSFDATASYKLGTGGAYWAYYWF